VGQIGKLIGIRVSQGIFIALGVSTIIFTILVSMPGDLATKVAMARYGEDGLDRERVEFVRRQTGLDAPVAKLYFTWMRGILHLDLGYSMITGEPVVQSIRFHLRMSLFLALAGLLVSIVIAVPIGIAAGLKPGSIIDFISATFSSVVVSIPSFVLGACLILFFSVRFKLLPAAGFFSAQSIILPAVTLGLTLAAVSCRIIRTAVTDVKGSMFLLFARMKGLSGVRVFLDHGIRNGAVPVVTFLVLQLAHVLDGIVVLENLFNWPGIGVLLLESIQGRDLSMIQGVTLVIGFMYVALNLMTDLICALLDPRQYVAAGGST
jgi:peptide/nickel transport system permease protein